MVKLKKDKKLLIISILGVLILFLIVYSFGGSTTGEIVKDRKQVVSKVYLSSIDTIIKEENPVIKAGDLLHISVETGSSGIKNTFNIYSKDNKNLVRKATGTLKKNCGGVWCTPNSLASGTVPVKIDWNGTYCVGIYDRETKKEVESCFKVEQ